MFVIDYIQYNPFSEREQKGNSNNLTIVGGLNMLIIIQ